MPATQSLTTGFVLHQRAFRETSSILELFTRESGRVSVLARGARGVGRRGEGKRPATFRPYCLAWAGRGELPTLKTLEPLAPAFELRGDAIYAGLYANELLIRLCTRHDPHEELFSVYEVMLERLQSGGIPLDIALRYFERDLLTELGYGLNLLYEAEGDNEIVAELRYDYFPERGAVCAINPRSKSSVSGAMLLAFAADELQQAHSLEARRLMRANLAPLLGDKPLKSLETLKRMKQLSRNHTGNDE